MTLWNADHQDVGLLPSWEAPDRPSPTFSTRRVSVLAKGDRLSAVFSADPSVESARPIHLHQTSFGFPPASTACPPIPIQVWARIHSL